MAQKVQFLGFKRVFTGTTMAENYLYFVRANGSAAEGELWFNNVCYGKCRDTEINDIQRALDGFLSGDAASGTTVKDYIDAAVSAITSGMTTSVELDPDAFSGLTIEDKSSTPNVKDYVINLQNVAREDLLEKEIQDREDADDELWEALSAETKSREEEDAKLQAELNAVENSLGFNDTAYTQDGTYITGGTVAADIAILDEVLASYRSGSTEEIDTIEEAVGLNSDGSYVEKSGTNYLDDATSVEGEIDALDKALKEVADRTVTEGSSTENYVKLTVATDASGNATVAIDDSDLKDAIEAMDYSGVTENGQAIVNVTEIDGKITATQGDIAAEHVTIADAGSLFDATNVEDALAELAGKVNANEIENADGSIAVTPGTGSTDINVVIKSGEHVLAKDGGNGLYTDIELVKITEGLPEAVKERYQLLGTDDSQLGVNIDVPKDSHIVSINYITTSGDPHYQNLEYVYIDASGNTQTVYVDMSQLVLESEFASGVTSIDGVVRGVVDPASEKDSNNDSFLTVGADGFKVDGIKDEIDAKIAALDVTGDTAVAGQYVAAIEETDGVVAVKTRANVSEAVLNNYAKGTDASAVAATDTVNQAISKLENQVDAAKAAATTEVLEGTDAGNNLSIASGTAADGHVQYTINLTDVASASALTQEISDREDADEALQTEVDAIETAVGLSTGGTYIPDDGKYVSAATSVAEAVQMLNDALEASESDWEEALAEEIAARESGDTQLHDALTAETSAREEADQELDERLDAIEEAYLTGLTVNGVVATVSANTADVTIQADDIELGTPITGDTASTISGFDADDKVDEVLQAIVDKLNEATAGSYTGVTSNDKSINLTPTTNGQDLSVNVKTLQVADVQAGETEVKKDESTGALYGVMYWIDEETA